MATRINIIAPDFASAVSDQCKADIRFRRRNRIRALQRKAATLAGDAPLPFVFSWKTDKAWSGACRRLELKLNDGTTHSADFVFK